MRQDTKVCRLFQGAKNDYRVTQARLFYSDFVLWNSNRRQNTNDLLALDVLPDGCVETGDPSAVERRFRCGKISVLLTQGSVYVIPSKARATIEYRLNSDLRICSSGNTFGNKVCRSFGGEKGSESGSYAAWLLP